MSSVSYESGFLHVICTNLDLKAPIDILEIYSVLQM